MGWWKINSVERGQIDCAQVPDEPATGERGAGQRGRRRHVQRGRPRRPDGAGVAED